MKHKFLTLLAAMAVCISCSAKTNQPTMSNHKAIVVFFSHAGENYSVGNIKVGNTKIVADYISELIGADQAEIVTHKYDGMAYTPLTNLAQDEQNNDERPDFELVPEVDFSQYDTIFIGGPVWWGTYPSPPTKVAVSAHASTMSAARTRTPPCRKASPSMVTRCVPTKQK